MSSGLYDSIVSRQDADNLFGLFKKGGAKVSLSWQKSDHELITEEVQKAKEWWLKSNCSSSFPGR
jgi:predicted esterase